MIDLDVFVSKRPCARYVNCVIDEDLKGLIYPYAMRKNDDCQYLMNKYYDDMMDGKMMERYINENPHRYWINHNR